MKISAIAIVTKERGLGKDNKLLFHVPGELPRFKKITTGHPIVMGRKTYDSIGKTLPNRTNIVITRDANFTAEGVVVVNSLAQALEEAKKSEGNDEIFILGGGQIFQEALPQIDRLYLTVVDTHVFADTFFPDYEKEFTKVISQEEKTDWEYPYIFFVLERNN